MHRRDTHRMNPGHVCEPLEQRMLLSTFTWTNRGSDNFATRYGANAELARTIVDRALTDWGRVIVNFNRTSGNNNFNLTINATAFAGTTRGSTSGIVTDPQGKPLSASISMDDNGGGAGWYFDPVPGTTSLPDDAEFTDWLNPFMARATFSGADFYRTIAHEVGHAVGILIGFSAAINDFLTNTGVTDPVDGSSRLYAFNVGGGPIEATLTTGGGGHFYEGPAVPGHPELPFHPGDLLNPGRSVVPPPAVRQIISDLDATVLQQAYGYTVTMPSDINTFHANLNTTTGLLTVLGTNSSDTIQTTIQGSELLVRVNNSHELIPTASISDIMIDARDGTDGIAIFGSAPGVEVRVRPSAGDDGMNVGSDPGAPVSVLLEGPVHRLSALVANADSIVRLEPGPDHVLVFLDELPLVPTSRLDLSDGTMIIDYSLSSPIDTIESFLTSAYNSGDWLGPGIGTSMGNSGQFALGYAEATDLFGTFPASFAGQEVDDTTILIRFTRYGDANLDGTVNLDDFNRLAANFGQANRRWSEGNFNFDNATNLSDFNLLAGNFGASMFNIGARGADDQLMDVV